MNTKRSRSDAFFLRVQSYFLLLMFGICAASAHAITIPAGSGTLSYTPAIHFFNCTVIVNNRPAVETYDQTTYSGFSYTVSGITTPLSGSDHTTSNSPQGRTCPANVFPSITFTVPTAQITFTPSGSSGGTAKVVSAVGTGYVDPKFLVVGVTYAPAGPSASTFVQYQNSTFVGNTQSVSRSFTSSGTQSVSFTFGVKIPLVANGKITQTFSTTNSQTTKNTSTVTTSMQVSQGEETFGTGNYFAPVNHDYDQIWVWLNPVAIFTIYQGESLPVWNGYGFDGTDQPGMDIVPIALGYLNGDFGTIPADIRTSINRGWAAGQVWPVGEGPALTSADLAQIASADPFSVSTYGLGEIGSNPPSPETADHRFTLSLCSGISSFNYRQANPSTTPNIYTCQLTYTNLSTQAQEISKKLR